MELVEDALIKLIIKACEVGDDPWQRHREVTSEGLPEVLYKVRAEPSSPFLWNHEWDRVLRVL